MPRWYPGALPMEATAWRYFLEWLTEPDVFPDDTEAPEREVDPGAGGVL